MNAVRIRKRVDSDTLHLPELRAMIGKEVEIIFLEEPTGQAGSQDLTSVHEAAGKIALIGTRLKMCDKTSGFDPVIHAGAT